MPDQQDRLSRVVENGMGPPSTGGNGMGPPSTGGTDEPERAGRPVEPIQVTSGETIPAAGQVITNPISGKRIIIRESSAQTGGRLLSFDLFLPPGAHVPARHVHPVQQEQFTVVAGRMRFRLGRFGRRTIMADPGDTVLVPAGTAHWFGNAGAGRDANPAKASRRILPASQTAVTVQDVRNAASAECPQLQRRATSGGRRATRGRILGGVWLCGRRDPGREKGGQWRRR